MIIKIYISCLGMASIRCILLMFFISLSLAQELLPNPKCNQKMDPGTCDTQFSVKWYYDRYAHRCREFYYGGCDGTENRFDSQAECNRECSFNGGEENAHHRCSQPHDIGTCDSDIERWYFDWKLKRCVCSWWSGCGGNSNRFYSPNHCMLICGDFAEAPPMYIQPDYIPQRPLYRDQEILPPTWARTPSDEAHRESEIGAHGMLDDQFSQWHIYPHVPYYDADRVRLELAADRAREQEEEAVRRAEQERQAQPEQPQLIQPTDTTVQRKQVVPQQERHPARPLEQLYTPVQPGLPYQQSAYAVKTEDAPYIPHNVPPFPEEQPVFQWTQLALDEQGVEHQTFVEEPARTGDPYFTGKFDEEHEKTEAYVESLDPETVLRGDFHVPPRGQVVPGEAFTYEPSRREDAVDQIFESNTDYPNDYQYISDAALPELRVGNEGFITPPPSQGQRQNAAALEPLRIRGTRRKKDESSTRPLRPSLVVEQSTVPLYKTTKTGLVPVLEPTLSTPLPTAQKIRPRATKVTRKVGKPRRKIIKVPRKKPLKSISTTTQQTPIVKELIGESSAIGNANGGKKILDVPQNLASPQKDNSGQHDSDYLASLTFGSSGELDRKAHLANTDPEYEEYYTEMEPIDEDAFIEESAPKTTERVLEIPGVEVPTEMAMWTRNKTIWHAAIPPHMVPTTGRPVTVTSNVEPYSTVTTTTQNQETNPLLPTVTTTEGPAKSIETPLLTHDPLTSEEITPLSIVIDDLVLLDDPNSTEKSENSLINKMPTKSSTEALALQLPHINNDATDVATRPAELRRKTSRPPKTSVDIWSWMRKARPTRPSVPNTATPPVTGR